jgi:hypothetical protein
VASVFALAGLLAFGAFDTDKQNVKAHFLQAVCYFVDTVVRNQVICYGEDNFFQDSLLLGKINEIATASVIFAEKKDGPIF